MDEGKIDYKLVIVEAGGVHYIILILYMFKIFHQRKLSI